MSVGVAVLLAVVVGVVVGMAASRGSDSGSDRERTADSGLRASPQPTATTATATTPATSGATATGDADTGPPFCGPSRYVEEITVQQWADGRFRISLRPASDARHAGDRDEATTVMWDAVRRCVRGIEAPVGDSLRDQLRCHEYLALVPAAGREERYATGETFDLESWRPAPGRQRWISTRCGNTLGTDPTTPPARTYRPDGAPVEHTVSGERA
jgi:hypothetical protein